MLCDKSRLCWHVRNRGPACFDVTVNRLLFVQEGPVISFNAATTLHNFCLWQQTQNVPDDAHPAHHDTAVLITRCGCRSGPSLVAALLPCMHAHPHFRYPNCLSVIHGSVRGELVSQKILSNESLFFCFL